MVGSKRGEPDTTERADGARRALGGGGREARAGGLPRPRAGCAGTGRSCTRSSSPADELPIGWTDRQDGGTYRLERRNDEARFGYAVGPHSWKQFLFPPRSASGRRARRRRRARGRGGAADETPLAFFGVRSCELHAIAIQDRVFLGGRFVDRDYAARREGAFVVAVNCFEPGGTCFCVSMGTGPAAESGYDLALTEILEGEHRLLVEVGTERGAEVLAAAPAPAAADGDLDAAARSIDGAAERMGRQMDATDLRELLADNLEHPRWDDVAERCLTCGNCTLVCPTCFCSSVEDVTDLAGRARRALAHVGHVLLGRPLLHPRRQRPPVRPLALPAVDDAQARHLARPVRHVRLRRLRPLHHLVPGRDRHHRGGGGDPRDRGRRRTMPRLDDRPPRTSRSSPGWTPRGLALVAGCASNVRFEAGRACSSARASRRTRSTSSATARSRSRRSCRRAAR